MMSKKISFSKLERGFEKRFSSIADKVIEKETGLLYGFADKETKVLESGLKKLNKKNINRLKKKFSKGLKALHSRKSRMKKMKKPRRSRRKRLVRGLF